MDEFSNPAKNRSTELSPDEAMSLAEASADKEDSEVPEYVKADIERGFKEIQVLLSAFHPYSFDNNEYLINLTSEEMTKIHSVLAEALESGFEGRPLKVVKKSPKYTTLSSMLNGSEDIKKYRKTLEQSALSFKEFIMHEVKVQFPSEVVVELNMKEVFQDLIPNRETLHNIKKNSDKAIDLIQRSVVKQISGGRTVPEGASSLDLNDLDREGHLYKVAAKKFMENRIDNSYDEIRIGDYQLQLIGRPITEVRDPKRGLLGLGFRAFNFGINEEDLRLKPGAVLNVDGFVLHIIKNKSESKIRSKINLTDGKKAITINHEIYARETTGIKKILV